MNIKALIDRFDAEDDPQEPRYDPVHLAALCMLVLVAIGLLYWLLWTLLVFEGGLFSKIGPALNVLLGRKTLKDYGYLGDPYAMGVFEGWQGNLGALILAAFVVVALFQVYKEGARRARR
jgi:hypothetical protein